MFGLKIIEFDNSDGTVKSFNEIFPNTPLKGFEGTHVEILDIVENEGLTKANLYVRNISRRGFVQSHDFGYNNFANNEDFQIDGSVRFKYQAKDLQGNLLVTAYNCQDLANQLNCDIGVVKRRLVKDIDEETNTEYQFNVIRKEI